jgi:hypothetical protein
MFGSRRQFQPVRLECRQAAVIALPPEVVMGFLLDPASALLIGPTVQRVFRAPDTPVGAVGEQHVYVTAEGDVLSVEVDEVVELDFPTRVTTVTRTAPGDLRIVYEATPRDSGGSVYTQTVSITVQRGQLATLQAQFQAHTDRAVARIKEILENGEWRPAEA